MLIAWKWIAWKTQNWDLMDWLMWPLLFTIVIAFIFVLFIGLPLAIYYEAKAHERFMNECLQHRPQYECTAIWRAGNRNQRTVQPAPIIIPMR